MIDATAVLAPERATLLELLRGMSAGDWNRSTECPAWTVKGIVLHILGDDLSLLSRQRDAAPQGLLLFAEDHAGMQFRELLDGFNDQWVHAAQFLGTPLIIELVRLVGEWSDDFYCNVGLDTVAREPVGFFAQTEPSPYWQLIAREYAERIIHQSQIRRAIAAPELDGELVTWMARIVVHSLAHWLRDYEAPTGSTITIDWGPRGAWTWQREPDGWSPHEGAVDAPTATVTVAPERAVALLTRGMSVAGATAILEFGGDAQLARAALERATPLLANP
ncbi:MAG TPA: maleylpyruvate isomerase N-terminal domain-containing protein [Acidimicrobiia bacterium]